MAERPAAAAYRLVEGLFRPTDHARGPWFAEQQHGAAVLALLARSLERAPSAQPMRFTRITADISRAVPMIDLTVDVDIRRDGRRVQSLEATITDGSEVFARAVATRIRVEPGLIEPSTLLTERVDDMAPPFGVTEIDYDMGHPTFHDLLEIRQLDGERGANRVWYRLAHPLIEGEELTPLVRMAATADMVQSSAVALGTGWMSINPEVSLQIEREPVGEWLCNASIVRFTDDGIGVSESVMFDRTRRVGASSKSVLNTRR